MLPWRLSLDTRYFHGGKGYEPLQGGRGGTRGLVTAGLSKELGLRAPRPHRKILAALMA